MDERQQFNEVVLPYLDDALSLARWLTGSVTDAEDVVQDACVRAYGAIATVRSGNPRAWLLAIVRNTAFTWLAKNRPKEVIVTDDEHVFEQAGLEMIEHQVTRTPEAMRSPRPIAISCRTPLPLCRCCTANLWSCVKSRT